MAGRSGNSPPWPGSVEQPQADGRNGTWPATAGRWGRPPGDNVPRWLGPLLWLVGGALIGVFLTVVLLLFAGPRPAPVPAQPTVGHVTVTVDDAYLTAAVRQAANSVPVVSGFSGLTAHALPGDRILISGTTSDLLVPLPVSMTLQPLARGGQLSMHVLSASVGGAPLPAVVDSQVERSINAQLGSLGQSALSGTPQYVVTGVATSLGHLTLTLGPAS